MTMPVNPNKKRAAHTKKLFECDKFQEQDVIWRTDSSKIALNGKNYVFQRS